MLEEKYEIEKMMFEMEKGRAITPIDAAKLKVSLFYNYLKDRIEYTAAVVSGVHLADNRIYEGAPRVSQQDVEESPRRWIIEECVPACEILWSKNIYTFMCSDRLDKNAWIELKLSNLSSENLDILRELCNEYHCYQYHEGCLNISVDGMGKKAQKELINIANRFVMQDVPVGEATYSIEDVYKKCGCVKTIPNPNYVSLEEQLSDLSLSNWGKCLEDPVIEVFDPSKVNKSFEEYIDDCGAVIDPTTGIIYRSVFHYCKHLRYINSLENKKGLK